MLLRLLARLLLAMFVHQAPMFVHQRFIVGSQALVNFSPARAAQLADSIERLGVPTFLGGTARGLLGHRSDIQFRHKRSKALRERSAMPSSRA